MEEGEEQRLLDGKKEDQSEDKGNFRSNHKQNIGLQNRRALIFLALWYVFSGITLFLNKYILSYQNADPHVLCECYSRVVFAISKIKQIYSGSGMHRSSGPANPIQYSLHTPNCQPLYSQPANP